MPKPKLKSKRKSEPAYQHKQSAVNITIYDPSGQTIDPRAQEEFEDAALRICQTHRTLLLSICTT